MTALKIRFHPAAKVELEEALAWYEERGSRLSRAFAYEFDHALKLILDLPDAWPAFEVGTRRFLLQRFPYSVVFLRRERVLLVVAIAHQNRRPRYWRERLGSF